MNHVTVAEVGFEPQAGGWQIFFFQSAGGYDSLGELPPDIRAQVKRAQKKMD
jgi:hypothetical protein